MKKIDVVIGAGYGDEGKGLVTDYLSSDKSLVVRFNGGAQAGHTVQTSTQRHVFSHFGSGSFKQAPTFLSRFFVVNPTLFMKEAITLNAKISVPDLRVYVSSYAPVTTPFDVAINQVLERFRSGNRHGSCGIGFGETLERENFTDHNLSVAYLHDTENLRERLYNIFENYVPLRLQRLGVTDEFLKTDAAWPFKTKQDVAKVIDDFINTVSLFNGLNFVKVYDDDQVLNAFDHLVFEGAQGLLLDQDYGQFPHVTRSNTGLKNVMDLLKNIEHDNINAHYLTRAYVTRHGAGPLENELLTKPYEHIEDETNIRNEFQGHLRFTYLNIKQYSDAVRHDVLKYGNGKITPISVVTCCDQVPQTSLDFYDEHGNRKSTYIHHVIRRLAGSIEARDLYISYGPTRNTLQKGPRQYVQS